MNWKRIAEHGKLYGKKKPAKNKKARAKERRSAVEKFARDNKRDQTISEMRFSKLLRKLNMEFEPQVVFSCPPDFYIVDFYLPQHKVAIEIDGGYHKTVEQQKKDRKRTQALKKHMSISKVLRFNNEDLNDPSDVTWRLITGILPQVARLFDKHSMQVSAEIPGACDGAQYRDSDTIGKIGTRTLNHDQIIH